MTELYDQDADRPDLKLVDYPTFAPTLKTPEERADIERWWLNYHDFCWPCDSCGECHHPDHENYCPSDVL